MCQGKCDREIGKPGNWHSCNRKAKFQIVAASGIVLEYCERHTDIKPVAFKPAPFAVFEPIRR